MHRFGFFSHVSVNSRDRESRLISHGFFVVVPNSSVVDYFQGRRVGVILVMTKSYKQCDLNELRGRGIILFTSEQNKSGSECCK